MNLTRDQRRQLQAGDCTSLLFPYDPKDAVRQGQPVQGECCVMLRVEERRRVADQLGNVTVVPARTVHWVEVTSVKRHRKGDWQVRFDKVDLREHPRFPAAGGGYTSSRFRAIDELEAVPAKYQDQVAKKAYDRDAAIRLEGAVASRQQWRRTKRSTQREMRRVFPVAA